VTSSEFYCVATKKPDTNYNYCYAISLHGKRNDSNNQH
ncbi:uncharacterized protein METZ01_LOCUS151625, partial [marine metagenome]